MIFNAHSEIARPVRKFNFFFTDMIDTFVNAFQRSQEHDVNVENMALQKQAFNYNKEWNQKIFDAEQRENEITREREDNAMQRAVKDARLAGINTATLAPNVAAGGASQGGITQANMLEAPQMSTSHLRDLNFKGGNPVEEIQKMYKDAQEYKMNQNRESREWERHDIEMIEKAESIEDLKQSKKAREIANRMAERMEEDRVSMETMRREIMELQRDITKNEKDLSDDAISTMRKYGIAPNDSPAIKHAKLMAASKHLDGFNGTEKDFIEEYKRIAENSFLDEFLERMEKSDVPLMSNMASMLRNKMPRGYRFGPDSY